MKKTLSIFLSALLVILLISPIASAETLSFPETYGDLDIIAATGDDITVPTLDPGEIWAGKEIAYEGDGEFEISLLAGGRNFTVSTPLPRDQYDIVLILDQSGSMGAGTKLADMKIAANGAVDAFLDVPGNRVAVVSYSYYSDTEINLTDSTGIQSIKNAIDGLSANGGTNIQNALLRTENLLKARSDQQRKSIVILMSDGEPTYYHSSLTNHTTGNRVGDGSPPATDNEVWNTILQAQQLKDEIDNLNIFTIGFGVGSNAKAIATLMPTDANTATIRPPATTFAHKYWSEGSALTSTNLNALIAAFTAIVNISTNILPHQLQGNDGLSDVIITDVVGSDFDIVDAAALDAMDDVSVVGNTITWTIPGEDLYTVFADVNANPVNPSLLNKLTFNVKVKEVVGVDLPTNSSAEASFYVDSSKNPKYGSDEQTINIPETGLITLAARDEPEEPGSIKVIKSYSEGSIETPEVEFKLMIGEDEISQITVGLETIFTDLEPGTYELKEVVPFGYETKITETDDVTVIGDGSSANVNVSEESETVVNVENTPKIQEEPDIFGSIKVIKSYSEGSIETPEVTFNLSNDDLNLDQTTIGLETTFSDLEPGEYRLTEVVPAGFTAQVTTSAIIVAVVENSGAADVTVIEDSQTVVRVTNNPILTPDPDPEPDPTPDPTPDPDPDPDPVGPRGSVRVHYEDTDGNELASPFEFSSGVGTIYNTAPRNFDGYELVSTPSNASGVFIDGIIDVIYVYSDGEEPVIEPEPTPLGPPVVPEEPIVEEPMEEIVLDEEVPLGDALPQTGQIPAEIFFGIGSILSLVGISIKKKK